MPAIESSNIQSLSFFEKIICYTQLFKLKLTSFVVISAVFGYLIGASIYNVTALFFLVVGGFLVTCSSSAFNQILEREDDKLMERTKNRPMPLNKISTTAATIVAFLFGIAGIAILWFGLNPLSGILGALAIFIYVVLYTPLKKVSTLSVFVGAFPGAIPPMLGWVAATGSFSLAAGLLFAMQFLWQFPHFWAIAWRVNDDYNKAGFKMLPFGKKSKTTAFLVLLSSITLFIASIIPEYFNITGRLTTIILMLLSLLMVYPAIKLLKTLDDKFSLRIMLMSYLYLILSLTIILIDKV